MLEGRKPLKLVLLLRTCVRLFCFCLQPIQACLCVPLIQMSTVLFILHSSAWSLFFPLSSMFENKLQGKRLHTHEETPYGCSKMSEEREREGEQMKASERFERVFLSAILSVYVCGAMRIGIVAFVDIFPSYRYKSCAIWYLIDRYADERAVIVTHRAD